MSDLLTGPEVVALLRLDVGRRQPLEALRHLRRMRRIGFVKIGKAVVYPRSEVERLIVSCTVEAL